MVEFDELESEIPSLVEAVRKFTVEVHGFKRKDGEELPSAPVLCREDEFYRKLVEEVGRKKITKGFVSFYDGNIYLNYDELSHGLSRQWIMAVLSYFTPYQFVLGETNYGKWLRETPKNVAEREERIGSLTNKTLCGVCKGFEMDAIKSIKGYRLDEIEDEIRKKLEGIEKEFPKVYEGYELYQKLNEKVEEARKKFDLVEETYTAARIVKASLLVAGRDRNFDENYRTIVSWPIEKIYAEAGGEIDAGKHLEHIKEVAYAIESDSGRRVGWGVAPGGKVEDTPKFKMGQMLQEIKRRGFPPHLIKKVEELYEMCLQMTDAEPFRESFIKITQDTMRAVQSYCIECERKPRITFR
jgi:hypothetical protein